ncbi:hypothetical protein AB6A23_18485 [Paenibacillus tarimensis]
MVYEDIKGRPENEKSDRMEGSSGGDEPPAPGRHTREDGDTPAASVDKARVGGDPPSTAVNDPSDDGIPPGAAPEWQHFYRAIRQAMLDIRSE